MNTKDISIVVGQTIGFGRFAAGSGINGHWYLYTGVVEKITPTGQVSVRMTDSTGSLLRFGADGKEIGKDRWSQHELLSQTWVADFKAEMAAKRRDEAARQKVQELGSSARHSSKANLINALETTLAAVRADAR